MKPFMIRTAIGTMVLAFTLAAVAAAAPTKPPPPGGVPLLPADSVAAFQVVGTRDAAEAQFVDVAGQPFRRALRLRTRTRVPLSYSVQIGTTATAPVKKGDALLATFYVRGVSGGQPETGETRTQFVFERGEAPHTKAVERDVHIARGGAWQRIDVPFLAAEDLEAAQTRINFRLGYEPQVIEIGGIAVLNYGKTVALQALPRTPTTYAGREPNAPWRKTARERIEKHRKGDLTVRVVDAAGRPVPGARVSVRMKQHAFAFGSAVAADGINGDGPDDRKYRDTIAALYNRVVMENDLKWQGWEQNPERAKKAVAWLWAQNIEVRGHTLVWPSWRNTPRDLQTLKNDKAALAKRVRDHIRDEAGAMRGQIIEWDVVNETFDNHDLLDILGNDALIEWFKLARATDPKPILFLNDYPPLDGAATGNAHLNHFEKTLRFLVDGGAPLGGIGFQCHFGGSVIPPTRLLSGLDRFARFGLPIEATELDINTTDEQLQAAYLRDFMTALFSHPSVNGIIMWGFWEGRHWKPEAALYRKDWSLKPVGQAWLDLVKKEWWTNASGGTDARGGFRTRGFLGQYEVTVTRGGRTKTVPVTLTKTGAVVTVPLG